MARPGMTVLTVHQWLTWHKKKNFILAHSVQHVRKKVKEFAVTVSEKEPALNVFAKSITYLMPVPTARKLTISFSAGSPPVTQIILYQIFLKYVRTIQHLNRVGKNLKNNSSL